MTNKIWVLVFIMWTTIVCQGMALWMQYSDIENERKERIKLEEKYDKLIEERIALTGDK